MAFYDKDKDLTKLEDVDEQYDLMDSMMEDMFGGGEVDEESNDHLATVEPEVEQVVSEPEDVVDEQPVMKPKKRVPLLKQIGVMEHTEDDNVSSVVDNEESNEVVREEFYDNQEYIDEKEYNDEADGIEKPIFESNESNEMDFIDDMLSEIVEDSELVSSEKEEVKVPLEKPGMDEVKVTPDGKTLAEMLPTMRGGRRKSLEVIAELSEGSSAVKVDGEKRSDGRYTSHVRKVEKTRAEQDKRRNLSTKFHQRNAKFTEQEKIIMENLGITNEQFAKLMGSTELSLKEKEEIIGLGRYGAEKHFKGRKYRTTVGDMAMLEFLTKFKFANTRILRWISNEPQGRTWRKLNRLRENGLVESESLIGIPDLWAATYAGVAIAGYDYQPGLRPMPKMITISSTMGVNYLAACLWFNTVNVLNLDDFPAHNRVIPTQEDGTNRVRGEMLVSELEIRSSLGKEINPNSTTMKTKGDQRLYDVISSNVRSEFEAWEASGRAYESPEMQIGNEYMWILYPTSGLTMSYHVPDLVVKRDRGPNGEPRSIAVEVERYDKSNDKYDKIMLAYKLDEHLYEKVVWVTPDTRVARKLQQAAENVGFDRYSIVPILTENGVYDKPDIWMI